MQSVNILAQGLSTCGLVTHTCEGCLLTHAMETHYCDCIIEGGLLTHTMEAHYCGLSTMELWKMATVNLFATFPHIFMYSRFVQTTKNSNAVCTFILLFFTINELPSLTVKLLTV